MITRWEPPAFFNQNVNPNEKWPWSEWVYTGENKTIRVGKADGSNVGQSGGSDNVTLQQANLPAVQIDVSGETSEQGQQELTTSGNGRHRHRAGDGAPGIPGRKPHTERITRNIRGGTIPTMQKTISMASRSRRTNTRPAAKQPALARANRSAWWNPTRC
ncbi:putative prophage tail fiber protein [Klebsiella pneumoniae]|nr:putative prophage tail fiber protein [Klebsiella pneumoniae]